MTSQSNGLIKLMAIVCKSIYEHLFVLSISSKALRSVQQSVEIEPGQSPHPFSLMVDRGGY